MARPTSYKSEYCDLLIKHMAKGLSFEAFAGRVGVSRRVLYDWLKAHEEFLHAREVGEARSLLVWERVGIKYILNQSESETTRTIDETTSKSVSRSLNAAVWRMNMQNRFAWRVGDKEAAKPTENELASLTDAELDQKIKQLETKLLEVKK